jgi:hypothetical protein
MSLVGIVGVITIMRGVILPFIGVKRVHGLLDWFSARGSGFHRGWALLVLAVSLWVAYAIAP